MPSTPSSAWRARRFDPVRCFMTCFSTTVIFTGTIILIVWLAIRPKAINYTVENASVRNYNFTAADDQLTGDFTFAIKGRNPNHKVAIYYDSIEATLTFDLLPIASSRVSPFFQPMKNTTQFDLFFQAKRAALSGDAGRDFKNQSSTAGKVDVDVTIFAKIRFKVWFVKSSHWMKVICTPSVPLSNKQSFQRDYCEVIM